MEPKKHSKQLVRALFSPIRVSPPRSHEYEYLDKIRQTGKFLFVTGMHRSGTTFLARYLCEHSDASGFRDIPGVMDEGQFVQSVFPTDTDFGGMGFFGYHPRSRMTEAVGRRAADIGVSLLKDWLVYLDRDAKAFIEKTPSNFRRSRLLASVFPQASFLHIVRHPVATALALKAFSPGYFGIKNARLMPWYTIGAIVRNKHSETTACCERGAFLSS